MLRLVKLLLYCGYCAIGTVIALLMIDPVQYAAPSTAAVLAEYRALYCQRDTRHEVQYQIGGAAAVSRIVVRSDLGTLALIEYAKCKAL